MYHRAVLLATLLLVAGAGAAQAQLPALSSPLTVLDKPLEIEAGRLWEQTVALPTLGEGLVPALHVRARINGGGGCNYMMRILLDGRPLQESWLQPRLLNKPPNFDPPGTDYHFTWWRGATGDYSGNAWMTIFGAQPDANWAGTGQDFDYVFALDRIAFEHGGRVRLGLQHTWEGLPAALKIDRAPLLVDEVVFGGLPATVVEQVRDRFRAGNGLRDCPVEPAVPAAEGPGARAYEVVWSGRKQPPAQVTFDNLTGWTAVASGDAAVKLQATREQRIWLPQTARLTIGKSDKPTVILLRPPQPLALPGPADALNLWAYGHLHFSVSGSSYSPISVSALLRDAQGVEASVDLGELRMQYWMLLHGLLPPGLTFPCQFLGLQVQCRQPKADYVVYLEALHCYAQARQVKRFPRPTPAVFPRNGEGILPTAPAGVATSAAALPGGARFLCRGATGDLEITVEPRKGCLEGISLRYRGGRVVRPCAGGGVVGATPDKPLAGTLLSTRLQAGTLRATWRAADGVGWEASYRVSGRSLIVDVRCPGGQARALDFGTVTGVTRPRALEVPYLNMANSLSSPRVVVGEGLFLSVLPDLYNSDRSVLTPVTAPPEDDRVRVLGEAVYTPLTDGRRNPLRERLFVTMSPEFVDVLPNHQNPPSPNRARLAPYMFVMGRAAEQQRWQTMRRYGLDQVIANDFAGIFVQSYSEGFGCRWRPHPDYTIEQVQGWRRSLKSLGYLFGAYLDVTDYYPLNEHWNESRVSLRADGDLADAWPGSFAPKSDFLCPLTEMVGRKMHELYPPDCVYFDVSTNWGVIANDYEAGTPGAGMARAVIQGVGDSLVEGRKWYGSTVSEGIYRWMYAGLSDMDYAQVHMSPGSMPLPLDFDLLKIHPYQIGTMMGYGPTTLLSNDEIAEMGRWEQLPGPKPFYKYVATSLAYGHMALLGYGYFPPMQTMIQYYALMQGLQSEYLPDTVSSVQYHDGERFLPTSAALQADAHLRGRVRVRYAHGLTLTANLSPEESWTVQQEGQSYELPPYGWVATKPGQILAYSAVVQGRRLDYVQCPTYCYVNTGGERRRVGPLEVQGAAWLKSDGSGWSVIPCGKLGYWNKELTLDPSPADRGCPVLIVDPKALSLPAPRVTAVDDAGKPTEASATLLPDGRLQLAPTATTVEFRLAK